MREEDLESRAGRPLDERLSHLEAAVEATGLGLWEWRVRTGEVIWNARNRALFGVAGDGVVTVQDYLDLVHPEDREKVRAAYAAVSRQPEGGVYTIEHRTARGDGAGRPRWVQASGRVIKDAQGVELVVGSTLDITDRKTAEARRDLIVRELAHRAKNGIQVMMNIVAQTARSAESVADFEHVLLARLGAMGESQDLLTQTGGRQLSMAELLTQVLRPFDPGRFDLDPALADVRLPDGLVVGLALLLHELSTNAVKYGALSAAQGRVALSVDRAWTEGVRLLWEERGGPPPSPPRRRGFGSRLLDVSLQAYGGCVTSQFAPAGFQAAISFPTHD